MAEIEGGGGGHKKGGKPKGKKLSTRVDFTPMVDLGFLLITFFMLTTSMNKPKTMEINMPVKDKVEEVDKTKVKASQAITVLLTENDKIVYYFINEKTSEPETPIITDFSKSGIRSTLLTKNRELLAAKGFNNLDSIPIYKEMYRLNKIDENTSTDPPDELIYQLICRLAVIMTWAIAQSCLFVGSLDISKINLLQ